MTNNQKERGCGNLGTHNKERTLKDFNALTWCIKIKGIMESSEKPSLTNLSKWVEEQVLQKQGGGS